MSENLIEGAPAASASPAAVAETPQTTQVGVDDAIFGNLLGDVEADPNAVPDGRYDAIVRSAKITHIKSKNKVSLVVNYQLEGKYSAAQIANFQDMGYNPVLNEDGTVKSFTPVTNEQQKQFLKKVFVDLGIPESTVDTTPAPQLLGMLVGRRATLTIQKRNGFRNIVGTQHIPAETPTDLAGQTVSDPFTQSSQEATPVVPSAGPDF